MTVSPFDAVADALDPFQPAPQLDAQDEVMFAKLRQQLKLKMRRNRMLERRYDGTQSTRHLNISVPPQLPNVDVVAGWGGKVVDKLEERIDFRGWVSSAGDLMGLDEIYSDNYMAVESSRAHVDACLYGVGYVSLGTGDPSNDEPEILVTAESTLRSTMLWDYRGRRAAAAYTSAYNERDRLVSETLYTPTTTYTFSRDPNTGNVELVKADQHKIGRVPMVRFINRDRASNPHGRSEITPPIRYFTDAAVRTLLGVEVNREFAMVPMLFALNVKPESFGVKEDMTQQERAQLGWRMIMGHINIVPPNDEGVPADIKQLTVNPPSPYIDMIRMYAAQVANESDLPMGYLGLPDNMAPDADAINADIYPLIRKAERRIIAFNQHWKELAYLTLLWRDGNVSPDKFRAIRCSFADPSTPTRSARADEIQKYCASGVLIPDSAVTYERAGFTPEEQTQLDADKRKYYARMLAQKIVEGSEGVTGTPYGAAPPAGGPGGPTTPPPVVKTGTSAIPAAAKNPNNVQRGKQIAQQAGQGSK